VEGRSVELPFPGSSKEFEITSAGVYSQLPIEDKQFLAFMFLISTCGAKSSGPVPL
jgi:hypothetical protein